MDNKYEIVEKEFGEVLEIEAIVPMMQMPKTMGNDFTEIFNYIEEKGVKCSYAPYAKYVDIDWDAQTKKGFFANFIEMFTKKWHFFSGFTIEKKLESKGKMKSVNIENRKYLTGKHLGPYHKVGKTYKSMVLWAQSKDIQFEPYGYEFYMNDPKEVKKEELETIIYIPIK